MTPLAKFVVPVVAAVLFFSAIGRAQSADLGRIDFLTSGKPEAQKRFLRGALLLHSFEFDDAAAEFREAEKLDPGFAMAYWGEAMTHNHPLWMEQDQAAALEVLKRLAPTREGRLAKAPTEREKSYLEAVEMLYGEGDKATRDRAYAEAMRRVHEKYPEDLEAASFYALALLGTCEGKRDYAVYMKAAAVAEEVFAKSPLHPGAVHYLIHCYDDPVHAPLGMRVARVYAKIAPAAGHALHMPSHIFFASGMWEEAAASNEAAWQASVDRARQKKLGSDEHSHHALYWLEYAYLQLGRYRDARKMLARMEEDTRASGSQKTMRHLASMRATYIVETRRCAEDVAGINVVVMGGEPAARELFVSGLCALDAGDEAGAAKILDRMKIVKTSDSSGHSEAAAPAPYAMGRSSQAVDAILGKELEALVTRARGQAEQAVTLAREAAAAEDALNFEFGPPEVVKPAHELAGALLLRAGRPADARKEFQAALSRTPGRALSLLGLARSAAQSGDATAARQAYDELAKNWSRADPDIPERREVEQSLAWATR